MERGAALSLDAPQNVVARSLSAIDRRILELENTLSEDDSEDGANDNNDAVPPPPLLPASAAHGSVDSAACGSWTDMLKARARAEGRELPVGLVAALRGSGANEKAKQTKEKEKTRKKKKKKQKTSDESADAALPAVPAVPSKSGVPAVLWCDCCRIQVNSEALMREHLQGKRHILAARVHDARAEARYCEACEIVFTGPAQLMEHCKGKKHKVAARERGVQ